MSKKIIYFHNSVEYNNLSNSGQLISNLTKSDIPANSQDIDTFNKNVQKSIVELILNLIDIKCKTLKVGNIDYSITDEEFDELMNSLNGGGGVARLIDYIYPIGSVITLVSEIDPNKLYSHQSWVRFAEGRTLIGIDSSDATFSTIEKQGGEKDHILTISEMPSHGHTIRYATDWSGTVPGTYGYQISTAPGKLNPSFNTGGSDPHNNLQPYIVVYYWKRIA